MKHKELTWQLHQARARKVPSLEMRKRFLEATYHGQLRAEKTMITSHIDRLQDAPRKLYLERRLAWLNKKLPS